MMSNFWKKLVPRLLRILKNMPLTCSVSFFQRFKYGKKSLIYKSQSFKWNYVIQGWLYEKHFEMNLPIPTCYYSKYEDNNKMEFENLLEHGTDSLDLSSLDSKNPDDIVESQRILILNNVLKQGFKPKNVQGTSFLSPMNVTHGLKEIAKLHALSWAFSKSTRKPLMEHFPFLKMTTFLPYLKVRINLNCRNFM